jgi:hypothetical protein
MIEGMINFVNISFSSMPNSLICLTMLTHTAYLSVEVNSLMIFPAISLIFVLNSFIFNDNNELVALTGFCGAATTA